MNKRWYKVTGWVLIIVGIISAFFAVYENFNMIHPTELVWGIILAILLLIFLIIPGRVFINTEENKLIKSSLILTLIGFMMMVISFILALIQKGDPFAYGMSLLIGLILTGSLYVIAVILLIINKLKK